MSKDKTGLFSQVKIEKPSHDFVKYIALLKDVDVQDMYIQVMQLFQKTYHNEYKEFLKIKKIQT